MKHIDTRALHHLAAASALDALEPDERAAFEAHCPTCEICSTDMLAGREVAAQLADAVRVEPPADLKASVLAAINRTRQMAPTVPERVVDLPGRRTARRRTAWVGLAAAAIIAVVGAIAAIRYDGDTRIDDIVAAPDAIVTSLDGPTGSLRIVWSPDRDQVAVFGNGLNDPGVGLAYALWFLGPAGDVAPAGLFTPDPDGTVRATLDVTDLDTAGWGVTIEPATGSAHPTTPVLYLGEI